MASAFLDRRKEEIDRETEREIEDIKKEILTRRPFAPTVKKLIIIGAIIGFALGILISIITEDSDPALLGIPLGAVVGVLIYFIKKGDYAAKSKALSEEELQRIADARARGQAKYDSEQQLFIQKTTEARKRYGSNTKNSQEVIKWLVQGFTTQIKAADRKSYIREVVASFSFSVTESKISAGYLQYDFLTNRYNNIPSFIDQVAFAQALALILQHDILKAFPTDPSDKAGRKSSVTISANDNNMMLTYKAANGNFIHAKTF